MDQQSAAELKSNTRIQTKQDLANDFIKSKINEFTMFNFKDDNLWEAYKDEFADIKLDDFKVVSTSALRSLRTFLRSRGVWVRWDRKVTLADSLYATLKEETSTDWTKEEIMNSNEFFDSIKVLNLVQPGKILTQIATNSGAKTHETDNAVKEFQKQQDFKAPKHEPKLKSQPQYGYGKELSLLSKLYEPDLKYTGEDDNFDFKLNIFIELCEKSDITEALYSKAYSIMLSGPALQHYYSIPSHNYRKDFDTLCDLTRTHFEGPEKKRRKLAKWETITLQKVINENNGKPVDECLNLLVNELRHLQLSLDPELRAEKFLRDKLINACRSVKPCQLACFKPSDTLIGLINDLQASIETYKSNDIEPSSQFFTDRKFFRNSSRDNKYNHSHHNKSPRSDRNPKKCYVCGLSGCHSRNHTSAEQIKAQKEFKKRFMKKFDNRISQYLVDLEDSEGESSNNSSDTDKQVETMLLDITQHETFNENNELDSSVFLTSFGEIENPNKIVTTLANHAFRYAITNDNFTIESQNYDDHYAFLTSGRYNSDRFYGIIIDTGASKHSTAGFQQFQAYQRIKPSQINKTKAGTINVQFGIGKSTSIGSTLVDTPIGTIEFHILPVDTPFLLSLSDMDKIGIYYDNTKNLQVSPNSNFPVSRRFGHAFLIWELRRLHRRFGHPSAERLYNLLSKSGHNDVPREYINQINKFCDHRQKNRGPPQRFKFKLQDDSAQFNHSIIVDVIYIDNHPVLHVVDEGTNFQAARWLQSISSKHTWDAIRACWIEVYIGPPDYIVTDAGSNFTGKEFHQCANSMAVCVKNIPVEAHWSIGLVERYHALLRRSYEIIYQELKGENISRDNILQMAVKSINDTAGPNGLIPTLLVFGAFPRMTQLDPPAPSIIQRASAIRKAMEEISKLKAKIKVNDALNHRNGPDTSQVYELPLNSDVLVWREAKSGKPGKWKGPYTLMGIENETCLIELPSGPTEFRSTSVRPYYNIGEISKINDNSLKFNGGLIHLHSNPRSITVKQQQHCKNLKPVQPHPTDILSSRGKLRKALSTNDQFVAQRARGAYVASVCQPEASFDLSFAAQAAHPNDSDIISLNKRLKWQVENSERGLRYVELDKSSVELVVFTDSSFANNKDFSSQIGFVVALKDKENRANILHWSSTKCKRVTRSVLAAELYALVNGFDSATTIKSTLENILCMQLPLIICTDSKSLYDCLVKLGTTREKRLMIDVMCLREAYEKREIAEIRWIKGKSNPADAMTKSKCCNALRNLIDTNSIFIETNEWVERSSQQ